MAISVGDMLSGLGAAIGGTGQQYVQGLKTREADARKQQMEEMEFRQKAMYEDANAAMQLFNQGDFSGIEQLGRDRLDMLRMFPDADPGDTARLTQLAMYAQRGDKPAIAQLHAELLAATRQGMARGYLQPPEQTKGVVVGENLVNPMTGEVIYQGQQKTTPYTDIAKLQQDLRSGLITREQYDQAVAGLGKEKINVYDESSKLRTEFTGRPDIKDFSLQSLAMSRIVESAASPSPAGDLALIFNYMKILDPGSTVREGEFANAQNAGGVDDKLLALYNNVVEGTRLTPEQRADFVNRAERIYKGAERGYMRTYDQYKRIAERRGLPVEDALIDIRYAPATETVFQSVEELNALMDNNWRPERGQTVYVIDQASGQKYKVNFDESEQ